MESRQPRHAGFPPALRPPGVTWSRTRPDDGPFTSIALAADSYQFLSESSRFKKSATRDDFELRSRVVTLDRPSDAPAGSVAVDAVVEGRPRRIWIQLPDAECREAIRDHSQGLPVTCTGDSTKTADPGG